MSRKHRRFFCSACALLLFLLATSAHAARFSQKIEWKADKNAFEYQVEVASAAGETTISTKTTDNFLELSLPAGSYRYRVTVYDFLGREANVTDWTPFKILKANTPDIVQDKQTVDLNADNTTLELAVTIADVTADSVVELVNEKTGKSIAGVLVFADNAEQNGGSETERATKAQFKKVGEGEWRLRVTNPSGLRSETEPFTVARAKKSTPQPEPAPAAEPSADEHPDDILLAEEEKSEEIEEEPTKKKDKKTKTVYTDTKDVTIAFGVGWGTLFGSSLTEYTDESSSLAFQFRLANLPAQFGTQRAGIELAVQGQTISGSTIYYDTSLTAITVNLAGVYRRSISFTNRVFAQGKLGGGVSFVQKELRFTKDARNVEQPDDKVFVYPDITVGASVGIIPLGFFSLDAGCDLTLLLIPEGMTAVLTPYVSVGLRL